MAPLRENQLKILLSDDELLMLKQLAEGSGLNTSDYVRQFIRRAHETAIVEAPAPKKRKRK